MLSEKISTALKRAASGPAAKMLVVMAALVVCVEVFASITWVLSGAGAVKFADLASVHAPERHPTQAMALHTVSEWPASRGRLFQEAPQWAQQVAAGQLPPVAERLPENPLVITPPHQMGPYGGTWRRYATGPRHQSREKRRPRALSLSANSRGPYRCWSAVSPELAEPGSAPEQPRFR